MFTIDRVQAALTRLGWDALRFDTDLFPSRVGLALEQAGAEREAVLEFEHRTIRLSEVRAVWLRRVWAPRLPAAMDPADQEACAEASRTALIDVLTHLTPRARWVNGLDASARAESKVLQLVEARAVGLEVPPTTLTNSPAWVERLRRREPRLVTKLLTPLSYAMQASRFVYTSALSEGDHAAMGRLKYAPQLFQPLIEKAAELRVVIVGPETFVGAIDASRSRRGAVDWRQLDGTERVPWRRGTLPGAVEKKARALLRRLGLVGGALDFIVTPDGRHVFLEVNPAGEWGWLERDLRFDISGAFARALTRGRRLP
ncbi:MAG: MvdC family ATP-grasp ribosomal peptide maturase [Myxococcaceae bacterium]|nr:MvdC family ATP-grasp ribosomal peptide maturase [Myxococcaceae bacterium]